MRKNIIIAICSTRPRHRFPRPREKCKMKMGKRLVIKVKINVLRSLGFSRGVADLNL